MKEAAFKTHGQLPGQLSEMRRQIASQLHLDANQVRLSLWNENGQPVVAVIIRTPNDFQNVKMINNASRVYTWCVLRSEALTFQRRPPALFFCASSLLSFNSVFSAYSIIITPQQAACCTYTHTQADPCICTENFPKGNECFIDLPYCSPRDHSVVLLSCFANEIFDMRSDKWIFKAHREEASAKALCATYAHREHSITIKQLDPITELTGSKKRGINSTMLAWVSGIIISRKYEFYNKENCVIILFSEGMAAVYVHRLPLKANMIDITLGLFSQT